MPFVAAPLRRSDRGGGEGKAPNARSLFEIGSITKVFTGVLLADNEPPALALEDVLSGL